MVRKRKKFHKNNIKNQNFEKNGLKIVWFPGTDIYIYFSGN